MTLKFKKIVKILFFIIAVIIIIISIPILIYVVPYSIDFYMEEAYYKEEFKTVCEYVKENQETFEDFSKYQISLYDKENTNMEIEREGEHQEWRNIVFKYANSAKIGTNDKGVYVLYEMYGNKYDILICYQNNIYLDGYEKEDVLVYVTNNISVLISRVR